MTRKIATLDRLWPDRGRAGEPSRGLRPGVQATRAIRALRGTAAAAMLLAAGPALAQTAGQTGGLALDRFDPAPAGDRLFGVASPYAAGHLTPHAMVLVDYAHNPFIVTQGGSTLGAVVANQLFLNLDAGLSLWNRLFVDVDMPFAVYQDGSSPTVFGQVFTSPSGAQVGDLRLGARVRVWGDYHDPLQLALGGYVWAPTGARGAFVSTGRTRGLLQIIAGGRVRERVVWSAAFGPQLQDDATYWGVPQGTSLRWGAGAGVLLLGNRHLQVGPEVFGSVTPSAPQRFNTNVELLVGARYRVVDDLELGLAAGPGLSTGIGTAQVRGVFSIAYTPEQKDSDRDGIPDAKDACPDVKGVPDPDPKKNGCPPDRDGDGIPDIKDACPDVRGVPDPDPKKNGCPPDRDDDGIPDIKDACPDVRGVPDPDPKKNGCPPDRDGDGVPDELDACPDVKGEPDLDPRKNGCPPDRDGDGISDELDACPDVRGVPDPDPRKNGCPPDRDGDGIPDELDACPDVRGVPDPDPKKNGCPKRVQLTEKEVLILEQVQFDVDRATIKKVSDGLVDEVASVLREHPEIGRLEVQGHTDNRGQRLHNMELSKARADAVLKALVQRGIARERLTSRGHGPDRPIADNQTEAGRQQNRRVQFVILRRHDDRPAHQKPAGERKPR